MSILDGITRPRHDLVDSEISNPRHSPFGITNRARLQVVGPDGEIKYTGEWAQNVLATYGLSRIVALLAGGAMDCSSWIGGMRIGTDSTAAVSTDNQLGASTGSVDLTDAADITEAGARTLRCVATFASDNPAGAATIKEIALFASSAVTTGIVNRLDLTGANSVNKGASDSINATIDLVFTTA